MAQLRSPPPVLAAVAFALSPRPMRRPPPRENATRGAFGVTHLLLLAAQPRDPIAAQMWGLRPLHLGLLLEVSPLMSAAQLRSLRDGVDALLMTGACRPAGLAFLRGAREGWGAADLARWLVGPYGEATSQVPRVVLDDEEDEQGEQGEAFTDDSAVAPPVRRVSPLRVRDILLAAQDDVEAELARASQGSEAFVHTAIEEGAVVQTLDGIWIALDRPRMLLKDRVLALFACDYLLRPQEYVDRLSACTKCGDVSFDPAARQTRHCGAHRISDFVELTRRSEPPPALRSA